MCLCMIYSSRHLKETRGLSLRLFAGLVRNPWHFSPSVLSPRFCLVLEGWGAQRGAAVGRCSAWPLDQASALPPGKAKENLLPCNAWGNTSRGRGFCPLTKPCLGSHSHSLGSSVPSGHLSCDSLKWGCSLLNVYGAKQNQSRLLKKCRGRGESATW